LVQAFKSTLEEAANADLVLNVCDISSDKMHDQIEVTNALLSQIGAGGIPVMNVLSKCDKVDQIPLTLDDKTVVISSVTGYGLEDLLSKIAKNLEPTHKRLSLLLPYSKGNLLSEIRLNGKVYSEEYVENGIKIDALIDVKILHKVEGYTL
ncbi:MAG: GTPase HflX, partial [Oscillospiraceae bacterium]